MCRSPEEAERCALWGWHVYMWNEKLAEKQMQQLLTCPKAPVDSACSLWRLACVRALAAALRPA